MSEIPTEGWVLGYDAVDPAELPHGAAVYYSYADGDYRNQVPEALGGRRLTIAVLDTTIADEYDVEQGNQDNPVNWAAAMRAAGRDPVVYCSEASALDVVTHFSQAGARPPYFRIAAWTQDGHPPTEVEDFGAGTVAVQYSDRGGSDANLISPHHPGLTRQNPAAAPAPDKDEEPMSTSIDGRAGLSWPAGKCHVIQANYAAANLPDLELNIELKLTTGPLYLGPWTISHETGTDVYEIPAEHITACRGAILTVHSGPDNVIYDVTAV